MYTTGWEGQWIVSWQVLKTKIEFSNYCGKVVMTFDLIVDEAQLS